MPRGQDGEVCTAAVVQERWGVRPEQIPDLKALVGDTSDLIPGVPGIGPKTAAALLARYENLNALYAALPALPARQADLLSAHQERVFLNRRLVTIVTAVEVPTAWEAYRYVNADAWTAAACSPNWACAGKGRIITGWVRNTAKRPPLPVPL